MRSCEWRVEVVSAQAAVPDQLHPTPAPPVQHHDSGSSGVAHGPAHRGRYGARHTDTMDNPDTDFSISGSHNLKFNRSMFTDVSGPCSKTGVFHARINKTHPTAFIKLDIRYKTLVTYQTFDCIIKVKTEFTNKSREFYNDNEDIAVMMFDMNYGYWRFVTCSLGRNNQISFEVI